MMENSTWPACPNLSAIYLCRAIFTPAPTCAIFKHAAPLRRLRRPPPHQSVSQSQDVDSNFRMSFCPVEYQKLDRFHRLQNQQTDNGGKRLVYCDLQKGTYGQTYPLQDWTTGGQTQTDQIQQTQSKTGPTHLHGSKTKSNFPN